MRPLTRQRAIVTATGALIAVSAALPAAYTVKGFTWSTTTVNFYINPANADLPAAVAEAAIQTGAATWGSQSAADFRFYYVGRTNGTTLGNNRKNEVFFRDTANGNVIAETYWWTSNNGTLVDADIVFYDGGMHFFSGDSGCSGGIYLEDTAAHEFGHALGLGHSADPDATMYYMTSWCSTAGLSLSQDDLAGVESLYPPSSGPTNTAPSVTITAPAAGQSFAAGVTVDLIGTASDAQDGNLSSAIAWSVNGTAVGRGPAAATALPAGSYTVTATVTDSARATATASTTFTVAAATPAGPAAAIQLTAVAVRSKNIGRVDIRWGGSAAPSVDLFRDGARVTTTANDGAYSDNLGRKASGAYVYMACETGTARCSNAVEVVF